ncbi:cell wall-binding repeat-containing protein [Agromyces sp. M3QZ16-3]|uniref:cell wall-binding repeat-containing protein n=1 Tax=Agromyces sp. M3QZ16-3 TaxID=3447585 RepID=UPI003F68BB88
MHRVRATRLVARASTTLAVLAVTMFGVPAAAHAGAAVGETSHRWASTEPTADGSISGTITEPNGETADALVPTIYRTDSEGQLEVVEGIGASHGGGSYTVAGLPSGDYFAVAPGDGPVVGATLDRGAAPTWFGGTTLPAAATPIHVEAGQPVDGIDITRVSAAIITGRVTTIDGPVEGARVRASPATIGDVNVGWANRNLWVATLTDAEGRFALRLSPGVDYSIGFGKFDGTVIGETWDDGSNGQGSPTHLNLEPGELRDGVDVELDKPVTITGSVRDSVGAPLSDIDIDAYEIYSDGREPRRASSTISGYDGTFEFRLVPGTYALSFRGRWPQIDEWWQDQADLATATRIELTSGETFDAQVELDSLPTIPSAEPTISGTAVVGSQLTAVTDGWAAGAYFSYRWFADGELLPTEFRSTLSPWPGLEGKAISVEVTGGAAGYIGVSRTSAPTLRVLNWATPTISGTLDGTVWVGRTVYAVPGTWSASTEFAYQWMADGSEIDGATESRLVVPDSVTGARISVKVTGTKPGHPAHSAISAETPGVGRSAVPTISGVPTVGATLSASAGAWTPGTSFYYQWWAGGKILPETGSTYTVHSDLVGKAITVAVSGKLEGYPTPVKVSEPTLRVAVAATPQIAGAPYVGSELSASPGPWTSGTDFAYQWYADDIVIPGAAASTYTVEPTLVGMRLTVEVTGTQSGYPTLARTSVETAAVTFETNSRHSGADRFGTSAAISRAAFARGVPVAYVASGLNFPDALSGAPAAGISGGPILLNGANDYLPWTVSDELFRLAPKRIVVLGGTGAVSDTLRKALESYTSGTVTRLAGADRFATSAAISTASFGAGVPVAYIANGMNFPDALSGAPAAATYGGPVLLTNATSIPAPVAAELQRLKPKRIVVLGGTGAVSDTLRKALESYTSGTVTRLAGADRFATSAAISTASFGAGVPVAYIANGMNFPDALSGAPAAATYGGPVLLTNAASIPAPVAAELQRLKPKRIVVLGGTGAVSESVRAQLNAYLAP